MSLSLYKDISAFPNRVSFYFSEKWFQKNDSSAVLEVFNLGNKYLKPFYSYADESKNISIKRKSTGMTVDLETELLGVFWLTYFNQKYVEYFGKKKLDILEGLDISLCIDSGVTCRVGDLPTSAENVALRKVAENVLGVDTFVNPELGFDKPRGPQALTYDQLRS